MSITLILTNFFYSRYSINCHYLCVWCTLIWCTCGVRSHQEAPYQRRERGDWEMMNLHPHTHAERVIIKWCLHDCRKVTRGGSVISRAARVISRQTCESWEMCNEKVKVLDNGEKVEWYRIRWQHADGQYSTISVCMSGSFIAPVEGQYHKARCTSGTDTLMLSIEVCVTNTFHLQTQVRIYDHIAHHRQWYTFPALTHSHVLCI